MGNNSEQRISILLKEINLIQNLDIKNLIKKILLMAPKYFWKIPSSNKGIHHPEDEYHRSGLILHTKRVVYLADRLCDMDNISGINRDKLIGAMIIHDICSRGLEDDPLSYSPSDHPFYVRKLTRDLKNNKFYDDIMSIVEAHLGRWTPKKYKIKKNKLAKFGHLADYIASRRKVFIKI